MASEHVIKIKNMLIRKWWLVLILLALSTCTVMMITDDEFNEEQDAKYKYAETMNNQEYANFIKDKSRERQAKLMEIHSKARDEYLLTNFVKGYLKCNSQNQVMSKEEYSEKIKDLDPELRKELMLVFTENMEQCIPQTVKEASQEEYDAENKYAETMNNNEYALLIKDKAPERLQKLIQLHSEARDKFLLNKYIKDYLKCNSQGQLISNDEFAKTISDIEPRLRDEIMKVFSENIEKCIAQAVSNEEAELKASDSKITSKLKDLDPNIINIIISGGEITIDLKYPNEGEPISVIEIGNAIFETLRYIKDKWPDKFYIFRFMVIVPTIDRYGNTSVGNAMALTYDMSTVMKINYENMWGGRILNLASSIEFNNLGAELGSDYCSEYRDTSEIFCSRFRY